MPKSVQVRVTTPAGMKVDRNVKLADILTPVIAIGPGDPEGGFPAMFRRVLPILSAAGSLAQLTVSGYGDDPRELGEIPEAVALVRRFVDAGGLGMLVAKSSNGLGALHTWALATGQITSAGPYTFDEKPFLDAYRASCDKFIKLVEC